MITEAQIDEQIQLERHQIAQGLKKLHDNHMRLEDTNYASATVYGISSIDTLLPLLVTRIDETKDRVVKGHNGVAFKEINEYLFNLETLAIAAIACKLTFDRVFSFKEGSNHLSSVLEAIGHAVEDECHMRHYEAKAPGLLVTLKKNYWHKSIGTRQKLTVIRTLMNRYDVEPWVPWTTKVRVKLGGWLLDCIMEVSGWFYKYKFREGRKTRWHVLPTPEFMDIKDQVMAEAELFSPLAWPMLIPPKPWSNDKAGGYMLNEVMHGHNMVRRVDHYPIQGEKPIEFLNKIQQVAYRLNPFIVDTAITLQERGVSVGKFLPIVQHDLPPKPVDIEENEESRQAYRRAAAEVMNRRAQEFRRSCRTRMTMEAVDRFKDKDRFYIPWSFDYRGRAYPIPAFLTPQDTDFGKSLIRFADESDVTPEAEDWLAFHVATTFGKDKDTMEYRLAWTKANFTLIKRVATDPIRNRPDWEGVEEPWQFLAACHEYYHCVILQDCHTTGLPVATDATCSGLQILAGLARDRETAQLVNVVPSSRPQDAYAKVAGVAKWNCPDSVKDKMNRKIVKRTVMTIPYNAKPFSNRSYIRDAFLEQDPPIEISKDDLTQTVRAVRDAMHVVVPGPMKVMKWIEDEVTNALNRGVKELEWITPSGFVVHQKIMKKKIETIELKLLGRCQLRVATDSTNEVDRDRNKAATAPNLIHSLDASLLHLSATRFNAPIALIHDSVLCRATDMSILSSLVRETYMQLFAKQDYLNDFADQIGAESEPPIIGNLEPETVIDSTYFFC